ncbi:hypothetical protein C8R47DRAFT_810583 [Mycena vitilis]|nr:hypothetical protein C8R47DRAFT_810583 [Mycena vitilis]
MSQATDWDLEAYKTRVLHPLDRNDSEAIEIYAAKLDAARSLAQDLPLEAGQIYPLTLKIPQTNPHPAARPVPSIRVTPIPAVRLNRPLQTGAAKLSQVWTAVVLETGTTLVLKIIQPSMCPYPAPDRCWSLYQEPEDLALREAWAYERIAHKQGILVPYFFGLHKIVTPSAEAAWVLAFEYIPSVSFSSLLRSPSASFQDICLVTKLSLAGAQDFGHDGWRHLDLNPDNILVTGRPGKRDVVFVDLSFTCRLPPSQMDDDPTCHKIYRNVVKCLNFSPEFQRWAEENLVAPGLLGAQSVGPG